MLTIKDLENIIPLLIQEKMELVFHTSQTLYIKNISFL